MADRIPLFLPLPRAVRGIVRPRRTSELVAVHDVMPVMVESLDDAQAPVVLRRHVHVPSQYAFDVRLHEGRFLMPLDYGGLPRGCRPEELPALLLDRVARTLQNRHVDDRRVLWDWKGMLGDAGVRGEAIPAADSLPLARIEEDGRAAQAEVAAHLARELVLVDGHLHHVVHAPRYMVSMSSRSTYIECCTPFPDPRKADAGPYGSRDFRPDRLEDAEAFASALRAAAGAEAGETRTFEVFRPDLVAAALPPDDLPAAAAAGLRDFGKACAPMAGHLDDADLLAYLELRALGRDGLAGDLEAVAAMDRLRPLLPPLRAIRDREHKGHSVRSIHDGAVETVERILLRHDAIDRPRKMGLPHEDATLLSLAP